MSGLFAKRAAREDEARPTTFGIHRYIQGSSNLFEENRLLKFAIVAQLAIVVVLGVSFYTSGQNSRTIVVPFGAGGDLYVTGNAPSPSYLRLMTRHLVAMSGTYSAYSADTQFQELLKVAHPSSYNGLRDTLNTILDELADNPTLSIATYIRPEKPITFTDREIVIPVEKVRIIGGLVRKFRGDLRLVYIVENGRFWLVSLKEENFGEK